MAKALIVFGSETGNTKAGADLIAKVLEDKGVTVEIQDVREVNADVLSRLHRQKRDFSGDPFRQDLRGTASDDPVRFEAENRLRRLVERSDP
ncbi:MAG: hypothetical protein R6W92_14900, partial [Desulfocurvibacter africanus]